MIPATQTFKEKVNNGDAPLYRMKLLTADGTERWIEDNRFWQNGISFSNGTSTNGNFDIGATVIGSFNFILNNHDGYFNSIDFRGAIVYPYAYYMDGEERIEIQKGQYYVATHTTPGRTIRCTALDGLKLFDQSNSFVTYPVSFESLVRYLAEKNNVNVANDTIPNGSYIITEEPEEALTDRQKLSYACQITGNYATMNSEGELYIGWYDCENPVGITTTFEGKDLWTKPITITGVSITIPKGEDAEALLRMDILNDGHLYFTNNSDVEVSFYINSNGELVAELPDGSTDVYTIIDGALYRTGGEYRAVGTDITFLYGTGENVLYVNDNPYITQDNLFEIAQMIGERVIGMTIRPGTLPVLSNPCLEAGDVLEITDRITDLKYLLPITNFVYNRSITETVTCDFEAKEYDDLRPTSEYNIQNIIRKTVKQYYTWIAYADDELGTNISLSNTGKAYIGIATNRLTETPDITDPTVYQWKKYVGTGVSSIIYYYKKQSASAPVPSTPTDSTISQWSTTEPTYTPGSTDVLYTCSKIVYSDGTNGYTTPQLSSSYKASKEAYDEASHALATADGKNTVYYQGTPPTGGTYVDGDTWFDTAHGNLIYEYVTGSGWTTSHTFGTQAIADLAITNAKIAALDAGKIQTGQLTTILIRSNNNDYWNLSGSPITVTEGGVTYTFNANTLMTNHLIAEDDIYIDGGPDTYIKIPTEQDELSYTEFSNGGLKIKSVSSDGLSEITTLYPSDMEAVVDILDASWNWDTETLNDVIYASNRNGESVVTDEYAVNLACDVYDENGNFVERSSRFAKWTYRNEYSSNAVQTLYGIDLYSNSASTIDPYIVPQDAPEGGYKYVALSGNDHLKAKTNYSNTAIQIARQQNNNIRNFTVDAETGIISISGAVNGSTKAWTVLLNGATVPSRFQWVLVGNVTGRNWVSATRGEYNEFYVTVQTETKYWVTFFIPEIAIVANEWYPVNYYPTSYNGYVRLRVRYENGNTMIGIWECYKGTTDLSTTCAVYVYGR